MRGRERIPRQPGAPSDGSFGSRPPRELQGAHLRPLSPLPRLTLRLLLALFAVALCWLWFGKLDIVAVARGKLVAETYVQVVQPAEPGVVAAILVKAGDRVSAGQVLVRLDAQMSRAALQGLEDELRLKDLQLRRIDAELAAQPLVRKPDDPATYFAQVSTQLQGRLQWLEASLQKLGTFQRAATPGGLP